MLRAEGRAQTLRLLLLLLYYYYHHHHHYCYYPGGIETDAIDIDAAVIALAREHPYKLG